MRSSIVVCILTVGCLSGGSEPLFSPGQAGCTVKNCQTMLDACRVQPSGTPNLGACLNVGSPPVGYDQAPSCVASCNASPGTGELIQCIADHANRCVEARDAGTFIDIPPECSALASARTPEPACEQRCSMARATCDDGCSGGRACANCRRALAPDCSSVCPQDAGFTDCMDCSALCGHAYSACTAACPRQ